jgi:GAF domain-containing protein
VYETVDAAAEPYLTASARLGGARSLIVVPMLKDDLLVGAIVIYRTEVRPFTDSKTNWSKTSPHKLSSPSRTRGC